MESNNTLHLHTAIGSSKLLVTSPRESQKSYGTILLFVQVLISLVVPMALFLVYANFAQQSGIKIDIGCEGPSAPFGMLSGLLLAIQLRMSSN